MTARGLRLALPLLALCALAAPAHADPVCVAGTACLSASAHACADATCVAVSGPCAAGACAAVQTPTCKPVQFTGRPPSLQVYPLLDMVDIDLSCLMRAPDLPGLPP